MGLFRDRAVEKAEKASCERKVAKMKPPRVTSRHQASARSAPAPYTCGRRHYDGSSCQSTVRGGVCPCREC